MRAKGKDDNQRITKKIQQSLKQNLNPSNSRSLLSFASRQKWSAVSGFGFWGVRVARSR
jgi:hypothetical protein